MPSGQTRGERKAVEVGATAQLSELKRTVGPAADGWEIEYVPGWGWSVVDPTLPHLRVKDRPHEPFGPLHWPAEPLRDVLAVATEAARITRRTFDR